MKQGSKYLFHKKSKQANNNQPVSQPNKSTKQPSNKQPTNKQTSQPTDQTTSLDEPLQLTQTPQVKTSIPTTVSRVKSNLTHTDSPF
jgi:hypothetical protein